MEIYTKMNSLIKLKTKYIDLIFHFLTINDGKVISELFQNKKLFITYNQIYQR